VLWVLQVLDLLVTPRWTSCAASSLPPWCARLVKGSRVDALTHPIPFFDGASAFVLVSGFLFGFPAVHDAERGELAGYRRVLRRTRLV